MADLVVTFDGGTAAAVYDDALVPVFDALGGGAVVVRASHVEPAPAGCKDAGWLADMRPSGGPVLGVNGALVVDAVLPSLHPSLWATLVPFPTRAAALAAERAWLARERGL